MAILAVTSSTNMTYRGRIVNINVAVQNKGELAETFTVTAYYDDQPIETQTVTNLAPCRTTTLTFHWNTIDVPLYTNHTIKAEANIILCEVNTTNNILTDGTVLITMVADLNGDQKVDLYDAVLIAAAYGSKVGDPNWNPNADLAPQYGIINIYDAVTMAYHYGETY